MVKKSLLSLNPKTRKTLTIEVKIRFKLLNVVSNKIVGNTSNTKLLSTKNQKLLAGELLGGGSPANNRYRVEVNKHRTKILDACYFDNKSKKWMKCNKADKQLFTRMWRI